MTNERGRGVEREYFENLSHGRLAYINARAKVSKFPSDYQDLPTCEVQCCY